MNSNCGVVIGIYASGNLFIWSKIDPVLKRIKGLDNFVPEKKQDSNTPDSRVWNNVCKTGLI